MEKSGRRAFEPDDEDDGPTILTLTEQVELQVTGYCRGQQL
jgi:hypothetical protein